MPPESEVIAQGTLLLTAELSEAETAAAAQRAANIYARQFEVALLKTKTGAAQIGAARALSEAFGGVGKNVTLATNKIAALPAVTAKVIAPASKLSGVFRALPSILSAVGAAGGLHLGALALAGGAVAFVIKSLQGETLTLKEKIELLGDASVSAAEKLRKVFDLSDLDLNRLNLDIKAIEQSITDLGNVPTLAAMAEAAALQRELSDGSILNEKSIEAEGKAKKQLNEFLEAGQFVQAREAVALFKNAGLRDRLNKHINDAIIAQAKETVATKANNDIRQNAVDLLLGHNAALDELNKNLQAVFNANVQVIAGNKAYADSLRGVQKAQEAVNEAIRDGAEAVAEAIASANEANADAIEAANEANAAAAEVVTDAIENLTAAQEHLNEVLAEGGEEELANARERLADATERVGDAEERRVDAAVRLAELLLPATQQELANATDSITTAEIALAQAIRKRDEALAALNATQEVAIDLAGLSLDELRSTTANARASAAAQRRVTKTGKSQIELREDATLAEIDVRDATEAVTEAKTTLRDLENKGIVETPLITAARKALAKADKDVAKAIANEITQRTALNLIESGVSEFAKTLKAARVGVAKAEERVAAANTAVGKTAQEGQQNVARAHEEGQARVAKAHEDAAARIVVARDNVVLAEDRVTAALIRQRDAQQEVNDKIAVAVGDNDALLTSKLAQIIANEDLIKQSPGLLDVAIASILASLPPLPTPSGALGHSGARGQGVLPGEMARDKLIKGINEILRDPKLPFKEAFRLLGIPGYGAEGALIQGAPGPFGKLMHVGEFGKPELLLPLTKPNRVWELVSQHLPKYPGALAAAQSALSPTTGSVPSLKLSGARATKSYLDEPLTERTGRRIAELLEQGSLGETTVNNEITLSTPVEDPALTARLLQRQIQRTINRRR